MKKRSFKNSLLLNKKTISNLSELILGGKPLSGKEKPKPPCSEVASNCDSATCCTFEDCEN